MNQKIKRPDATHSPHHIIQRAKLPHEFNPAAKKQPVAPPVYRPQPKQFGIQPKLAKPVPVRQPVPPVAQRMKPGANVLPKRPLPVKPALVTKSPPGPPAPAVLNLARQRTAQFKPATRPPVSRPPVSFGRHSAIQLFKVKDLAKCYKVPPAGDEQMAVHHRVTSLLAKDAERDVGDDLGAARFALSALVLERVGGAPTFDCKMMGYFLGQRDEVPAAQVSGLGSLSFGDGELSGRPGFLKSAFSEDEITGAPGRAFRHRSAWHYLKDFLNRISRRYGEGEIERLYDSIYPRVSPAMAAEANKLLRGYRGPGSDHKILWLAIVINSARSNLWLGPSKENISINSSAYHLKKWTKQLDDGTLSLPEYKGKVAKAKLGSAKAKKAQALMLKIITEAATEADPKTYIIQNIHLHCLSMLEVDLPDEAERESAPHHMRIYEIAHDIGGLADRERIIEALLQLEPRRASSRSRSPVRGGSDPPDRGRSRSRSRSPSPDKRRRARSESPPPRVHVPSWSPAVDVDSIEAAATRTWNAGDTFRLPDGRRVGVRSNHFGGLPFIKGQLWFIVQGG
jgi:hypothetical protein